MSHVATWDEEALKALPMVLEDKPLPRYASIGGIDSFNAREQWRKRGMTWMRWRGIWRQPTGVC
jgi:hypothetical protein